MNIVWRNWNNQNMALTKQKTEIRTREICTVDMKRKLMLKLYSSRPSCLRNHNDEDISEQNPFVFFFVSLFHYHLRLMYFIIFLKW